MRWVSEEGGCGRECAGTERVARGKELSWWGTVVARRESTEVCYRHDGNIGGENSDSHVVKRGTLR